MLACNLSSCYAISWSAGLSMSSRSYLVACWTAVMAAAGMKSPELLRAATAVSISGDCGLMLPRTDCKLKSVLAACRLGRFPTSGSSTSTGLRILWPLLIYCDSFLRFSSSDILRRVWC